MGFVGNYAPCGQSPQTNGMPVKPKKGQDIRQYPAPSLSLTIALSVLSTPGYLLFFPRTAVHAASITAPAATVAAANGNTSAVSPVFTAFAAELSAA